MTFKRVAYGAAVAQGLTAGQVRQADRREVAALAGVDLQAARPGGYSWRAIRKAVSQRLKEKETADREHADADQLQRKLREIPRFAGVVVTPVRDTVTGPNPGDVVETRPKDGDWIVRFP